MNKNKSNGVIKHFNKRLIIIVMLLIITIASGTFAWFNYASSKSTLVLTIGNMDDVKITMKPYHLVDTLDPTGDYTDGVYTQVTINNDNSNSVVMSLYYKINQLPTELINNGLKYTIVESNNVNGSYNFVKEG